jgi:hypothetical protein
MRKVVAAALAALVVLSAAGTAYAVNEYEVISGGSRGEGSPSRPAPGLVRFGFRVADTDGLRPSPSIDYRIGAEGLKYFPQARPSCTYAQASAPDISSRCRRALVGSGIARNQFGARIDRTAKTVCNLRVRLYNITGPGISRKRGGLAIRLDADQKVITDPESREIGCPAPIGTALKGVMHDVRIGGLPASELRFSVPENLAHPLPGVDNSVVESDTTVRRLTGRVRVRGNMRRVGIYSSIGCNGNQRLSRVTFTDETGNSVRATDQTNTC